MKRGLTAILFLLPATPALAHLPPGEYGAFAAGFTHPLFGFDHLLAMLAVGLWGGMIGGRALWALPLAFLAAMGVGFALALGGVALPLAEPMILGSVVFLGLALALALKPGAGLGGALVAGFALFHGFAHGSELGGAGALDFAAGFALATGLLHGGGVLAALAARAYGRPVVLRLAGAVTAVLGVVLAAG